MHMHGAALFVGGIDEGHIGIQRFFVEFSRLYRAVHGEIGDNPAFGGGHLGLVCHCKTPLVGTLGRAVGAWSDNAEEKITDILSPCAGPPPPLREAHDGGGARSSACDAEGATNPQPSLL